MQICCICTQYKTDFSASVLHLSMAVQPRLLFRTFSKILSVIGVIYSKKLNFLRIYNREISGINNLADYRRNIYPEQTKRPFRAEVS